VAEVPWLSFLGGDSKGLDGDGAVGWRAGAGPRLSALRASDAHENGVVSWSGDYAAIGGAKQRRRLTLAHDRSHARVGAPRQREFLDPSGVRQNGVQHVVASAYASLLERWRDYYVFLHRIASHDKRNGVFRQAFTEPEKPHPRLRSKKRQR
jgi:hypothetical protein